MPDRRDQQPLWNIAEQPEFLVPSLIISGIGLSDIGADRGSVGPSLLCRADVGPDARALITAINATFGLSGCTEAERNAASDQGRDVRGSGRSGAVPEGGQAPLGGAGEDRVHRQGEAARAATWYADLTTTTDRTGECPRAEEPMPLESCP